MKSELSLTAAVLTFNEEENIAACLESIRGLCPVFVVDSGSTDTTLDICKKFGAQVVSHSYENHASQWQWVLSHLPLESDWLLALDADFRVTAELKREIERELPELDDSVAGVFIPHLYAFLGHPIRHGGTKPERMCLVRPRRTRVDTSDLVDSRFVVDGKTVRWRGEILQHNLHDDKSSMWIAKQDKFALRLAVEEVLRRKGVLSWDTRPRLFGNSDERVVWLRNRWLRLPLFLRPVLYFLYRYLLRLGFLDGRSGFLYHVLQGFWLRLIVDWKILELRGLDMGDEDLASFRQAMLKMPTGSVKEVLRVTQTHEGSPGKNVSAI